MPGTLQHFNPFIWVSSMSKHLFFFFEPPIHFIPIECDILPSVYCPFKGLRIIPKSILGKY
jgi:hypothetical protein